LEDCAGPAPCKNKIRETHGAIPERTKMVIPRGEYFPTVLPLKMGFYLS